MMSQQAIVDQIVNDQSVANRRPHTESKVSPSAQSALQQQASVQSNILVALRLRPLIPKEILEGQFNLVKILDEKLVILQDPQDFTEENGKNELRKNRSREKQFAFDHAFDQDVSKLKVFQLTTQNLI